MLSWILRALVAISIADAANIIRVPLVPRQRTNEEGIFSGTLAKRKIGYSPLVDHVVFQGNYVDVAYLGLVSIGTPPQSFLVGTFFSDEAEIDIDTGSGVLWVADVDCRGCNVSTTHLFDQSLSSTVHKLTGTIQILYGQGAVICNGYTDTVLFGGISMDNFTFGSCYGENTQFYPESIGIIGIGFPQGGVNATAPCWIVEAYKRSIIPAPAYSLSLGRYTDQVSGTTTDGSLLVIGGYDPDLVDGAINWINCSASIHPQIPLDGLVVNGNTIKRVDNKPMQAIIDSGTGGFIPGPSNIVQAVYLQIAGAQPDPSNPGIYVFPCTSTVQIGFQFAGQNYMMNPEDFIMQRQGNQCVGILVGQDFIDDTNTEFGFILGAIFMKNVVTVFDLGRPAVGFGRIKNAGKSYGGYTIIPDAQATALGTGPSASLSATYNPPRGPQGGTAGASLLPNPVTVVAGTAPISPDLSGLTVAPGVPTSAGASIGVTSNIPTGNGFAAATGTSSASATTNTLGPVVTVLATVTAANGAEAHSEAPQKVSSEKALWCVMGVLTLVLMVMT